MYVERESVEGTGLHGNRDEPVREELREFGVNPGATFGGEAFNSCSPAPRAGLHEAPESVDGAKRLVRECLYVSHLLSFCGFRPQCLRSFTMRAGKMFTLSRRVEGKQQTLNALSDAT
jgi:hypothetical protein